MIESRATLRQNGQGTAEAVALSEVISALSYALDLTEGTVHGHSLRSCLVGMRIGESIGLGPEQMRSLYYALLLKDVAGSAFGTEHDLAAASLRSGRAAGIMRRLGMGEMAAEAVRCVDERWDGRGIPGRLKGHEIPLLARICTLARHLDMLAAVRGPRGAIETVVNRSGIWFDPELVKAARLLDMRGILWVNCLWSEDQHETRWAVLGLDSERRMQSEMVATDAVCEAFADVVDAKSHFTFSHSMGVADAAEGIAARLGLSPQRVHLVRRAALLHDIGKLSVPNAILDKAAALDAREWRVIRQHPGYTRRILERVGPFHELAVIAGQHHEKLDGSGYPHQLMARDLSVEARIVAVADIYGALSEDRPYRPGLEFEQIVPIMRDLAQQKLDGDSVEALVQVVTSHRKPVYVPPVPASMVYAAV